jgi:hypothetical protein
MSFFLTRSFDSFWFDDACSFVDTMFLLALAGVNRCGAVGDDDIVKPS